MISSRTWPCSALARADLASRTTLGAGGAAEWLLEPATPWELRQAVVAAREAGCEPRILGGGANLIVDDGLLGGVVICTDRLTRVYRPGAHEDVFAPQPSAALAPRRASGRTCDARLVAWGGASMPRIVSTAQKLAWKGVEALAGVPGSVGGGVAMNAGGRYGEIWDVVERLLVIDERGELVELERGECRPAYRDGGLGARIVAGAVLRLEPDEPAAVQERCRRYLLEKRDAQPLVERSAGCIFRNPDPALSGGLSAGRLIEGCGGKGLARGDAAVSGKHANFIVNRDAARAADVLGLIEDVHALVLARAGVDLRTEVRIWRA